MIKIPSNALYPILGPNFVDTDFASINLDKDFLANNKISSTKDFTQYHKSLRAIHDSKWLIGGYLEKRSLYQSTLFKEEGRDVRDIHLGVDIWGPVGTPIFAPLDGTVHSSAYNSAHLDYGYTLILEHQPQQANILFALWSLRRKAL